MTVQHFSTSTCNLTRRQFMHGCAGCAVSLSALPLLNSVAAMAGLSQQELPLPTGAKARVRLIFSHTPSDKPIWPNIGYDFEARKVKLLKQLRQGCPDIEFLPATAQSVEEAKKILAEEGDIDGYVVYLLGLGWMDVPETVAATGRPTIYVDDLYGGSGKFLKAYSKAKRTMAAAQDKTKAIKVTAVASSRMEDVFEALRCFECLKKLRGSVLLRVGRGLDDTAKGIEEVFGTKVIAIDFEELTALYEKADRAQARRWADRWMSEAEKVVEPSREEIEKSAAMYLAMCELMRQKKAQAVAVNCLGGFYGKKLPAYPCLGFCQLNNDGYVGACEADLKSAVTMLLMTYLTGRPGYISDPVIDTAKNQVIYAHCVAPCRVFGPNGPANAYHIRSHSEDRKGASVRSLMPLGEMTTTLCFNPVLRQVIFHQGKAVANIDEDMACRTKLAVEVKGDIDKLFNYWDTWGWHRVTVYGDYKRVVRHIAALAGFELIEEA